jgi:hypothetical protein
METVEGGREREAEKHFDPKVDAEKAGKRREQKWA